MRVKFTASARARWLAASAFIAEDNPSAARQLVNRATHRLRALGRFPHSGCLLPEFPHLPYREVVIKPFRFVYRIADRTVWVVDVWHSAQDTKPPRN